MYSDEMQFLLNHEDERIRKATLREAAVQARSPAIRLKKMVDEVGTEESRKAAADAVDALTVIIADNFQGTDRIFACKR